MTGLVIAGIATWYAYTQSVFIKQSEISITGVKNIGLRNQSLEFSPIIQISNPSDIAITIQSLRVKLDSLQSNQWIPTAFTNAINSPLTIAGKNTTSLSPVVKLPLKANLANLAISLLTNSLPSKVRVFVETTINGQSIVTQQIYTTKELIDRI